MTMTALQTVGERLEALERRLDPHYPSVISKLDAMWVKPQDKPIETSEDIRTPVWRHQLSFLAGGVCKFRGPMKSGKTRIMMAYAFNLIKTMGYRGNQVFANCWLDIPGAHHLSNDELKAVLHRAFNSEIGEGRWNHCMFLIMEADDLYSHIKQMDKQCFEDIKTASQSCKRNQYLLYEVHDGLGVPKYLRDKTEQSIKPLFIDKNGDMHFLLCNGSLQQSYTNTVIDIARMNNKYHRFDELW